MTAENAGRGELTELVSDHVLGAEDVDERATVVDLEGLPDELGNDGAGSCPGLDGKMLPAFGLLLDLDVELLVYVGAFFR